MATTGLIFGVVVAAWLAYLVPWYLSHRDQTPADETDPTETFARDARLLKTGELDVEDDDSAVSTPLTRGAKRREVGMRAHRAVVRRRRVLLALGIGSFVLLGTALARLTPWWSPVVGLAVLLTWVLVARLTVVRLHHRLDSILAESVLGDDEMTVMVELAPPVGAPTDGDLEHSVEISAAIPAISLWDPIPVSASSYVQRPLASRTVRTIDLSAPVPAQPITAPVTAGDHIVSGEPEQRRAVGE